MKPFFSIRIEYNPADNPVDQSHKDGYAVRVAIARQESRTPAPGQDSDEAEDKAAGGDQEAIVSAIVRSVMFLDRVYMDEGKYDFADDIMFEIANRSGDLEQSAVWLVQQVIEGSDDEFLDDLQKMIDKERKKGRPDA